MNLIKYALGSWLVLSGALWVAMTIIEHALRGGQ